MLKETVYLDDDLFSRSFPNHKREDFVAAIVHESAMSPTVTQGDRVLILPSEKFSTDGIYCIETSAGVLLRRIRYRLDGTHAISADSQPDDVETLEDLHTKIIGRVCMIWHATLA